MNDLSQTWPCLIVEGNTVRIVGSALLRDGRYNLIRGGDLAAIKTEIDGKTVFLHPDDVAFVYEGGA